MIPCIECICLAICKQKIDFKCSILYDFMEENIEYDLDDKVIVGSHSWEIWNVLNDLFQRENQVINFDNGSMRGPKYSIISKRDWGERGLDT